MVFDEGKHDRAPKGATGGGQFVKKGSGPGKQTGTGSGRRPARKSLAKASPTAAKKAAPAKNPRFEGYLKQGIGVNRGPGDDRVRKVQRDLNRLGIRGSDGKPLEVDGRFGPETERAVKELQRRLGLKATGQVDYDQMRDIAATKELPAAGKKKPKMCPCRSAVCPGVDDCAGLCTAAEVRHRVLGMAGIAVRALPGSTDTDN